METSTPSDSVAAATPAEKKPLLSIVLPALNEEVILEKNLATLCEYLDGLTDRYDWEIVFVNDGSTDRTGQIAEEFASQRENFRVYHHHVNYGLGQGFRTAFAQCRGEYIITLDIDLSYSPDHIERLMEKITETRAKIVIASPYMEGGQVSHVPKKRKFLSVWANRFLSVSAQGDLSTLTSMVRVYDSRFIKSLDLRGMGMEVMQEIIYKSMLLRAKIYEIPAHLDWAVQNEGGEKRQSSMKILRHSFEVVVASFLFRPFMFFILPGLLIFFLSLYVNSWVIIHFIDFFAEFSQYDGFASRSSAAISAAYQKAPHTFIVGGLTMMVSIQLVSLGIISLQSKKYFEEIFHLGTSILKRQ